MAETSLHVALKTWYALPGDQIEVPVNGYLIDILRDELLIEIQTRNFSALKPKLESLLDAHPMRIVHPIALEKWIIHKFPHESGKPSRRKSPRNGKLEDVFRELVRIPHFIHHPNFSLEILLTQEEETRFADGKGSWRRKGWSILDRRLLHVVKSEILCGVKDYLLFIPADLPPEFSTRELAAASQIRDSLAHKMVYCFRKMSLLQRTGKRGRSYLYKLTDKQTE